MAKNKRERSCFLYQPLLIKILVDLQTLETEKFAPYQVQDLFFPTLSNIFAARPHDFYDIQRHMYLPIFPKSRYNLRFWTILDKIAQIHILQVKLNSVEENVQRFFPRNISAILKKKCIESMDDFVYYENLHALFWFHGGDIDSFDLGFQEIYNNLYHLSKIDAMKEKDYGKRATVEHSSQITNIQKISHLRKMIHIFQFDTLKVSEFFGWDVYRLLTEAGLQTLKDVIYFGEIDTLIPQKNRREFHLKLSAVYYSFSLLEEIKKRI
jgi:hypothetical protein